MAVKSVFIKETNCSLFRGSEPNPLNWKSSPIYVAACTASLASRYAIMRFTGSAVPLIVPSYARIEARVTRSTRPSPKSVVMRARHKGLVPLDPRSRARAHGVPRGARRPLHHGRTGSRVALHVRRRRVGLRGRARLGEKSASDEERTDPRSHRQRRG